MRCFIGMFLMGVIFGCTNFEQQNLKITEKMFAAFNAHNWQVMTSCYSADAQYLDPAYGQNFVSKTQQEIVAK